MSEIQPQPSADILSYGERLPLDKKIEYAEALVVLIESIIEGDPKLNDPDPKRQEWGRILHMRAAESMTKIFRLIGFEKFEILCNQLGGISVRIHRKFPEQWEDTNTGSPDGIILIVYNRLSGIREELVKLNEMKYKQSISEQRSNVQGKLKEKLED